MQISQMFKRKPCVFSIECFPPKQTANFDKMKDTLRTMRTLNPDFISVTYGAGGSTGGVSTVEVAEFLKNDLNVEPLAHMICMGSDKTKAAQLLDQLNAAGVRNVLTLRGDRTPTRPESPDFAHASDLAQFVWQTQPEFDIHAACYPEGHPEAATLAQDVANLRFKQEAGATHLLTQLFFDNMPVSAGVMPIVKRSQIERTVALSSASLPSEFTRMISRYQDDPESLYAAGIDYAVQQLRDLIEGGADGVHLYAMNDAKVAAAVYEGIKDLL